MGVEVRVLIRAIYAKPDWKSHGWCEVDSIIEVPRDNYVAGLIEKGMVTLEIEQPVIPQRDEPEATAAARPTPPSQPPERARTGEHMADYRLRVLSGEAAANGDIHLDVMVERETEPDTWVLIPLGHRTLVLDGEAVLAITESEATDNQKCGALLALIRQEVVAWGIDRSDDAYNQLLALVPGGWPVSVAI